MRLWISMRGWCCVLALAIASSAAAQDGAPAERPAEGMVQLNFPENTSLKVVTDYVAQRLGLNIIYSNADLSNVVTIKSQTTIPVESLRTLLESLLKIDGKALVETEVPGTLRIITAVDPVAADDGPLIRNEPPDGIRPTQALTRIFELEHASPARVKAVLDPVIAASVSGGTVTQIAEHDMLMITEYAGNFRRIEELIALVDQPRREVSTRFIPVKHLGADKLAEQVTTLLTSQSLVQGAGAVAADEGGGSAPRHRLIADPRTNQIVLIARPEDIESAASLIASLDVSLGLKTEVYRPAIASPERVDELIRALIGEDRADRLYQSVADDESSVLVATTTDQVHGQIRALLEKIDVPVPEEQSPVRFYKLQHAKAEQLMETLREIEGEQGLDAVSVDGVSAEGSASYDDGRLPRDFSPSPPGVGATPALGGEPPAEGVGGSPEAVRLPDARIMADKATNTIIVIARPAMQPVYEKLIQRLDVRRPQVLVEATIVAIDTTDDFRLGVEFSRRDSADGGSLLNFTQFGLSEVDPVTGALTLNPGIGFNGALLNTDIAEVVIQALQSDIRSRVLTRPSVLVDDNEEGELQSKDKEPYESTNANNSISIQSFGGYAEAGTKINVTPSISEGDFLKLDYTIELSSFTDDRTSDILPPAVQENRLKSVATIPDGYTIVVGGLTREITSETIDRVPLLGQIPIVKYVFSSRRNTTRQITLFVFLRPVILRDDKFEDLKVLSGSAAGRAQLPADTPTAEPAEIR